MSVQDFIITNKPAKLKLEGGDGSHYLEVLSADSRKIQRAKIEYKTNLHDLHDKLRGIAERADESGSIFGDDILLQEEILSISIPELQLGYAKDLVVGWSFGELTDELDELLWDNNNSKAVIDKSYETEAYKKK